MRRTAFRFSESYVLPRAYRDRMAVASDRFGAVQLHPDELGGYHDFSDWRGGRVSLASFLGRWTLLYFGYSRCQGSCRQAAPVIAKAALTLRKRGILSDAMFVDLDATTLPGLAMIDAAAPGRGHRHDLPRRVAMGELALAHDGALRVVSGTRAQLSRATQAYHVLREHAPPRDGEDDISINHSSAIYIVDPEGMVAGYGYHDLAVNELVELVGLLANSPRRSVDREAIRNRSVAAMCGTPDIAA